MSNTEDKDLTDQKKIVDPTELDELYSSTDPAPNEKLPKLSERATSSPLALVFSILALVVSGATGWLGYQYYKDIVSQLVLMDKKSSNITIVRQKAQSNELSLATFERTITRLQREVDKADANNQSILAGVAIIAEQIAKAQVDTRSNYVLAEAEYLLKLADQRLLIERNPEIALRLMQKAQALLSGLDDGRLLRVREKIAVDIQKLSVVPNIDIMGLQAQLLALDSTLDELTLPVIRLTPIADKKDTGELAPWLDSLSNFIRIRKIEAPIKPLVSAADAGRAREVLRLSLEQIKAALIREDQVLFDSAVQQARRLMTHYFDTKSGAGLRVLATLDSVHTQKIARDIPEAASGLRALKSFRDQLMRERIISAEAVK